ncbi:hypothetical protein PoB_002522300 [Plakobranchus ocellatus]|uniref:DUF7869 domain-containing protein n=1 Tax=Plakobranchus ocellatus TaxID=259542 RepID=A0AAV3ZV19_9GAST|nr:hypothetical protein PoB_002522300 [Plakobranchus ocellatus]
MQHYGPSKDLTSVQHYTMVPQTFEMRMYRPPSVRGPVAPQHMPPSIHPYRFQYQTVQMPMHKQPFQSDGQLGHSIPQVQSVLPPVAASFSYQPLNQSVSQMNSSVNFAKMANSNTPAGQSLGKPLVLRSNSSSPPVSHILSMTAPPKSIFPHTTGPRQEESSFPSKTFSGRCVVAQATLPTGHDPDESTCGNNQMQLFDEDQKHNYAKHLESKEKAREMKTEAKEKSMRDREFGAMCFDMQQLLPCPKSNSSTFYYKRKLYVHNLTMYDLGTAEVRCFMWPEFEAQRGASEVATCLAKFTEEKSKGGCKDLSLFSDNCPRQNHNRFVAFMLSKTSKRILLDELSLTFLRKGHTENENDSDHCVIKKATKHAPIYSALS